MDAKKEINNDILANVGLIRKQGDFTKLLSKGEVKSKITIAVDKASDAAIKAIEAKGGKVIIAGKEVKEVKKVTPKKTEKTSGKKPASKVKKS